MGKTKTETSEEISEKEFKDLVSSSASKVKQFLVDNPQVVFKGVPVLMVIYLFYPAIAVGWYWFPWAWALYQAYNSIPTGTIPVTMQIVRTYLNNKPQLI